MWETVHTPCYHRSRSKRQADSFSGTFSVVRRTGEQNWPCFALRSPVSALLVPHRAGGEVQASAGSTERFLSQDKAIPIDLHSLEPWRPSFGSLHPPRPALVCSMPLPLCFARLDTCLYSALPTKWATPSYSACEHRCPGPPPPAPSRDQPPGVCVMEGHAESPAGARGLISRSSRGLTEASELMFKPPLTFIQNHVCTCRPSRLRGD